MRRSAIPLLTFLLAGCGPTAAAWPVARAGAECGLYERCDLLEAFGGTAASCEQAVESLEAERLDGAQCDYAASSATACLAILDTISCDEYHGERPDPIVSCDLVCGGRQ